MSLASLISPLYRPLQYVVFLLNGILFNSFAIANTPFTGLMIQEMVIEQPIEPSCSVLSPENGYNYSQLHARLFQPNATTRLPSLSQTWQVICTAPVAALFLSVDADVQSDSLSDSDPTHFGLGHVNGQGHLGYYQVTLDNAMVDGNAVQLYQNTNQTLLSAPQSRILLKPNIFQGWTQDGQIPAKGQQYSVRLTVSPTLYSLQETQGPLVNGAELNGELILTFPFSI
nr:hypothetical protein [uncultured Moellerella sp.]